CEPECFARNFVGHAGDLEHDAVRLHHRDPAVGGAFARTHAGFGRLRRHRLVGEDADPDLATALHLVGHGAAGGLDVAAVDPGSTLGLQPVLAEGDGVAGRGQAAHLAAVVLAMLDASWL